jgi:hypothetical protein
MIKRELNGETEKNNENPKSLDPWLKLFFTKLTKQNNPALMARLEFKIFSFLYIRLRLMTPVKNKPNKYPTSLTAMLFI